MSTELDFTKVGSTEPSDTQCPVAESRANENTTEVDSELHLIVAAFVFGKLVAMVILQVICKHVNYTYNTRHMLGEGACRCGE